MSSESPLEEAIRLDLPLAAEIDAALDRERNRHETALSLVEAQNLVRTGILDAIDDELDAVALERDLAPLLYRMSKYTRSSWPVPEVKDVDAFVATIENAAKSLLDPQRSSTDEEWNKRQLDVMIALDWDLGQLYDFVLKGTTLFLPIGGIGWLELTLGAPLPTRAAAFYASDWPELVARKFEAYKRRADHVRTSGGSMPLPIPRELATGGDLAPVVVADLVEQATRRGQKVLDAYLEKGGKTQTEIDEKLTQLEKQAKSAQIPTRGEGRTGEYAERRKTDAQREIRKLMKVSDRIVTAAEGSDFQQRLALYDVVAVGATLGRFGPRPTYPGYILSPYKAEADLLAQLDELDQADARSLRPAREAAGLALLPVVGQSAIEFLQGAIMIIERAAYYFLQASGNPSDARMQRMGNLVYMMITDSLFYMRGGPFNIPTEADEKAARLECNANPGTYVADLLPILRKLLPNDVTSQPAKWRTYVGKDQVFEPSGNHDVKANAYILSAYPRLIERIDALEEANTCANGAQARPGPGRHRQRWTYLDVRQTLQLYIKAAERAQTSGISGAVGSMWALPYVLASLAKFMERTSRFAPELARYSLDSLIHDLGFPFYLSTESGIRQTMREEKIRIELSEQAQADVMARPYAVAIESLRDTAKRTLDDWDGVRKLYKKTARKFPQELINAQIPAAPVLTWNPTAPRAARAVAASALKRRRARARRTRRPGGTRVGVARARDISSGRNLSERTLARTRSFFARHDTEAERAARARDPMSPAAISWDLWGGDPMRAWLDKRKK